MGQKLLNIKLAEGDVEFVNAGSRLYKKDFLHDFKPKKYLFYRSITNILNEINPFGHDANSNVSSMHDKNQVDISCERGENTEQNMKEHDGAKMNSEIV